MEGLVEWALVSREGAAGELGMLVLTHVKEIQPLAIQVQEVIVR